MVGTLKEVVYEEVSKEAFDKVTDLINKIHEYQNVVTVEYRGTNLCGKLRFIMKPGEIKTCKLFIVEAAEIISDLM